MVEYPLIQKYVDKEHLTLQAAQQLDWTSKKNLNSVGVRDLFLGGRLTFDQAKNLTLGQRSSFEKQDVRQRFKEGKLSLELVEYPLIQKYVDEEHLTLQEAQLGWRSEENLNSVGVRAAFDDQSLTFDLAKNLTDEQRFAFEEQDVLKSLNAGIVPDLLRGTPNIDIIMRTVISKKEIRKNARILYQVTYGENNRESIFKKMPDEAMKHIVSYTGDGDVHESKEANEIASKGFGSILCEKSASATLFESRPKKTRSILMRASISAPTTVPPALAFFLKEIYKEYFPPRRVLGYTVTACGRVS